MEVDHQAAERVARETVRDHEILHGGSATAAQRFAALERSQKDADRRGALLAAAYLDLLARLPSRPS